MTWLTCLVLLIVLFLHLISPWRTKLSLFSRYLSINVSRSVQSVLFSHVDTVLSEIHLTNKVIKLISIKPEVQSKFLHLLVISCFYDISATSLDILLHVCVLFVFKPLTFPNFIYLQAVHWEMHMHILLLPWHSHGNYHIQLVGRIHVLSQKIQT